MVKLKHFLTGTLIGIGISSTAQMKMNIALLSNSIQNYPLADVKSISFPSGRVNINKLETTSESFLVSQVKNITFEKIGDPLGFEDAKFVNKIHLFPNPLIGSVLSLNLNKNVMQEGSLEILNVAGLLEKQHVLPSTSGTSTFHFQVEDLKPGVYFYSVKIGETVESGKFIKY